MTVLDMKKDELINTTQMGKIAGVSVQAITNMKSRYSDFPNPIARYGRTELFIKRTFVEWLKAHGRAVKAA